jgi:hypothetical protein
MRSGSLDTLCVVAMGAVVVFGDPPRWWVALYVAVVLLAWVLPRVLGRALFGPNWREEAQRIADRSPPTVGETVAFYAGAVAVLWLAVRSVV